MRHEMVEDAKVPKRLGGADKQELSMKKVEYENK